MDIAQLVVDGYKNTHHKYKGYEIWKKNDEKRSSIRPIFGHRNFCCAVF